MENDKDNFGLPMVDNTPTGIIGMEGDLYRGVTSNKRQKSNLMRLSSFIFSLFILFIPGIALLYIGIIAFISNNSDYLSKITTLYPTLLGIVFTGAGIVGMASNIRKKRP